MIFFGKSYTESKLFRVEIALDLSKATYNKERKTVGDRCFKDTSW